MTYYTRKARGNLQLQIEALKSDRIKNVSMIFYGIAVGSGYILLVGSTIGYQDLKVPMTLLLIGIGSVLIGRSISALADLSRLRKKKVKRFLRRYLRLDLFWW
jgi:hypothetical protein